MTCARRTVVYDCECVELCLVQSHGPYLVRGREPRGVSGTECRGNVQYIQWSLNRIVRYVITVPFGTRALCVHSITLNPVNQTPMSLHHRPYRVRFDTLLNIS